MTWIALGVIIAATGVVLILLANALGSQVVNEVNSRSGASDKIGPLLTNVRLFDTIARHRALFPDSPKRKSMMTMAIAGVILGFGGCLIVISWLHTAAGR